MKFPERFSWKTTKEEYEELRSKFLTTKLSNKSRTFPRVFTEQGVAMLATILKSKIATKVSIEIMDAFVSMRKYLYSNLLESKHITNLVLKHENLITEHENKIEDKEVLNLILNRL